MSFAYMPLYTGDYLRDTQHLSCSEHGIYLRLLMHCWDQKGPAPVDERRLCGIVNARSGDEIEALRRVLNEYFIRMDDGWYNKRMQEEVERSENISRSRSDAGRKGYQAKAKQLLSTCQASDSTPTPTPIPIPIKSSTKSGSPKKASAGPDVTRPDEWDFKAPPPAGLEAEYVLAGFNKLTNSKYRAVEPTLRLIRARLREHSVGALKNMMLYMSEKWDGDEKMSDYIRPKTFFNATNCQSYVEQARKAYAP